MEHEQKQYVPYVDSQLVSHRIHGVNFGVYSDEEIKRLSLKVIHQVETFDCLGHSTVGGLYDLDLGPQRVEGPCVTCGLNMQDALPLHKHLCPGHFGHLSLPLPVFNPVLFKDMMQILRIMCFKCHRLLATSAQTMLFSYQMDAANYGLLTTVQALQEIFIECTHTQLGSSEATVIEDNLPSSDLKARLEECLADAIKSSKSDEEFKPTKNSLEVKRSLLGNFLLVCRARSTCMHCNEPRVKIRQEQNCKVVFELSAKARNVQYLQQGRLEGDSEDQEKAKKDPSKRIQLMFPHNIQSHLRQLWENEGPVLRHIISVLTTNSDATVKPIDLFFKQVQLVIPTRFRQLLDRNGYKMMNAETDSLLQIIKEAEKLKESIIKARSQTTADQKVDQQNKIVDSFGVIWQHLQSRVNSLLDCRLGKMFTDSKPVRGVTQLLEHKAGLLRWNMMGKRVDFAARSVISPDPCIATNEVGIPLYFAKRLTYPEPVTPHNVYYLRNAVINGPDVYPGATHIILENGEKRIIDRNDIMKRKAVAKQLLVPFMSANSSTLNIKVLRHIRNGDILLMNRQPSLHRPSMQAHKARILPQLKEEKTLRMHYSNCKAYNADFDGDEMNAHFPQNELARCECYTLASTDYQYLVPKDGTPLAGLIQDYMVSGVWLTMRGQFFTQVDYEQLVYGSLVDHTKRIRHLKPSILKPARLWSGKQVVSTVLINLIPQGKQPFSLVGKSSISEKKWVRYKPRKWRAGGTPLSGNGMTESEVVIRSGHLLVGVLDKAHYGASPYGLVHSCYELYGGQMAGKLLTCLARLFNIFLHFRGFSMGVEDIIVKKAGNAQRRELLSACDVCGPEAAILAFGLPADCRLSQIEASWRKKYFSSNSAEVLQRLDGVMNKKTSDCQDYVKQLIMPEKEDQMPGELLKTFPTNNLQMMFLSGAKGTQVNCVQISCTLGQISLEGRRPPLMLSGASLPSFKPYDVSPRAGGFVAGRFLTGLRPQEYFFHCMAGREGLVDTAVKTSHSGYLQRCLIKQLEGLMVSYDMTVRDNDGSVVQFYYGEDGVDVSKSAFIRRAKSADKFPPFSFLVSNKSVVASDEKVMELKKKVDCETAVSRKEEVSEWMQKFQPGQRPSPFLEFCRSNENSESTEDKEELLEKWHQLSDKKKQRLKRKYRRCPDPVNSVLRSDRHFGSISESLDALVNDYIQSNPDKMLCSDEQKKKKKRKSDSAAAQPLPASEFQDLIHYKYLNSLVPPGDCIGLLAAQSIGEPSTQMTLNTFHFAGHQAMNVTLGIPRLREILMTASKNIKTPVMEVPVRNTDAAYRNAEIIAKKLTRVYLTSVIKKVSVETQVALDPYSKQRNHFYTIYFEFNKQKHYRKWTTLKAANILSFMERKFFRYLSSAIDRTIREMDRTTLLHSAKLNERKAPQVSSDEAGEITDDKDQRAENDADDDDDDDQFDRDNGDYDSPDEGEGIGGDDDDEDIDDKNSNAEENARDDEDTDVRRSNLSDVEEEDATDDITSQYTLKNGSAVDQDTLRILNVKKIRSVSDYSYDASQELWCKITYKFPLMNKAMDIKSLLETEIAKTVVYQTRGIKQATASKHGDDKEMKLRTEGINIQEMYNHAETLCLNRLYTNDIHAMAEHYGIEAAYQVIMKEISAVFELYQITVSRRHLSLIADYMTFEGQFKPFNRTSLTTSVSPLQNMSFETTMRFLHDAIIDGSTDDMSSPSSRIVVGRIARCGTGSFDVVVPVTL